MTARVLRALANPFMTMLGHPTGRLLLKREPIAIDMHAVIDAASWQQGPVFDWLAGTGNITEDEMRRTFNCGVGMIVAVDAGDAAKSVEILNAAGESAWEIGRIAEGSAAVQFL